MKLAKNTNVHYHKNITVLSTGIAVFCYTNFLSTFYYVSVLDYQASWSELYKVICIPEILLVRSCNVGTYR